MIFAAIEVFKGAGVLIYPLAICSAAAVYIVCERAFALRGRRSCRKTWWMPWCPANRSRVASTPCWPASWSLPRSTKTIRMRVKAFARLEINRMERGIRILM
jgi:biopolymer transport protein ExbB